MRVLLLMGVVLLAYGFQAKTSETTQLVVGEGLREPFAVDFDAAGRMFIAEQAGHRVSVFDKGRLTVLAGAGEVGLPEPDATGVAAHFNGPHHLLVGPDRQLYVADTFNNTVRRIDPASGRVTRFAGTGEKGFGGDGGPAAAARLNGAFAIDIRNGTLYIADLGNRRIRAVNLASGTIRTVAGSGDRGVPPDGAEATAAPLVDPRAVAVDDAGRIYICERAGHALRVVDTDGRIRTVAGTGQPGFGGDGGPALKAAMNGPKHISIDTDGSVLITDTENHVIRRYRPSSGTIARVAGTGEKGAAGMGGGPAALQLNRPHGAFRHGGALYISDSDNHRVIVVR
jgi:DNA-binding beta-propeller fold protein YncE